MTEVVLEGLNLMAPMERARAVLGLVHGGRKALYYVGWTLTDVETELDRLVAVHIGLRTQKLVLGDLTPEERILANDAVDYICGLITLADKLPEAHFTTEALLSYAQAMGCSFFIHYDGTGWKILELQAEGA